MHLLSWTTFAGHWFVLATMLITSSSGDSTSISFRNDSTENGNWMDTSEEFENMTQSSYEILKNDSRGDIDLNEKNYSRGDIELDDGEPFTDQVSDKNAQSSESTISSETTMSWLEELMYRYRKWKWIVVNTVFMVAWILFGFFSLYRLMGLYWCTPILSRSRYLVVHLLIFTASMFSMVHLLHLTFGNYQGLPLFLTLLLTHTPSPCLAFSCGICIHSIFGASKVSLYKSYTPPILQISISASVILVFSFIGDVVVGISHSSGCLLVFRLIISSVCLFPLISYIWKFRNIRRFQETSATQLGEMNASSKESNAYNHVNSILKPWSIAVLVACICGVIMLIFSFILSLFFTISKVALPLFWFVHFTLFLSQICLIICITISAAFTLINVNRNNFLKRYFVIPVPKKNENFVQQGNFVYHRVSVDNLANGNVPIDIPDVGITNNLIPEYSRPKITLKRSATFNCPPRGVMPLPSPITPGSVCHCPIDENEIAGHCSYQCINPNYYRLNSPHRYGGDIFKFPVPEEHSVSSNKFPVMGCHGRARYGSLHSLPNGSPRNRVGHVDYKYGENSEKEQFISNPTEEGSFVKDIIMENQNLFRSQSFRQNSMRRKIGNKERSAIRTVPSQRYVGTAKYIPEGKHNPVYDNSTGNLESSTHSNMHCYTIPNASVPTSVVNTASFSYSPQSKHEVCTISFPDPPQQTSSDENNESGSFQVNGKKSLESLYIEEKDDPKMNGQYKEINIVNDVPESIAAKQNGDCDNPSIIPNLNTSTLPSKKSLKRNNSATVETINAKPFNIYDTWAGRRSKKKLSKDSLAKLSGSRSSLSNIYEKLKPKKTKSALSVIDNLPDEEPPLITEPVVEVEKEESEEDLPKISDEIDLASEILKQSSIIADFMVSKNEEDSKTPISLEPLVQS